jgi:hypothetical protein
MELNSDYGLEKEQIFNLPHNKAVEWDRDTLLNYSFRSVTIFLGDSASGWLRWISPVLADQSTTTATLVFMAGVGGCRLPGRRTEQWVSSVRQ